MPLRDHFRSPPDDETSCEGFHGQWPAMIVIDLARRLPAGYVASPRVHLGAFVEIDVATYEGPSAAVPTGDPEPGGSAATAVWTPPLWLSDNLAIPLELESSYEETCRVLRLP